MNVSECISLNDLHELHGIVLELEARLSLYIFTAIVLCLQMLVTFVARNSMCMFDVGIGPVRCDVTCTFHVNILFDVVSL